MQIAHQKMRAQHVKEFLQALVSRVPLMIFLVGTLLIILSAFGQVPIGSTVLQIKGQAWQIVLAAIGVCLLVTGLVLVLREIRIPPVSLDVFLAYPMAAWDDPTTFQHERGNALQVIEALRGHTGIKSIYFAGQKITSIAEFEEHDVAAEIDLKGIDECKYFVMVFPEKLVSSVLFEAGYALAKRKPAIYFVRDQTHLPFIMRNISSLPKEQFPSVKVYEYQDINSLLHLIEVNKKHLLPKTQA